MCLFVRTRAATPAPADKLEKNGKEVEKEEDKEEGEAPSDKVKEKEKDEGKEVDGNRTADPEEVPISAFLISQIMLIKVFFTFSVSVFASLQNFGPFYEISI